LGIDGPAMNDTSFERCCLADVVREARNRGAKIRDGTVLCSWEKPTGDKWYLFEYGRFSVGVWAENAYHARALGWDNWIASVDPTWERIAI